MDQNKNAWEGWQRAMLEEGDVAVLMAEQHNLNEEKAPLWAIYGAYGVADNRRKIVLSDRDIAIRAGSKGPDFKITDKSVEAAAHAEPEYKAYIDTIEEGRTKLMSLDAKITFLEWLIQQRRSEEYFKQGVNRQ